MKKELSSRPVITVLVLVLAVVSCFPLASITSRPESFASISASIDKKTDTVMKLTATSTAASAAISAIPDDTATPIAEKLADFTEYFLLILCTLYAEKYLLTIIGLGTFRILIPLGCALYLFGLYTENHPARRLAIRMAAFGLTLFIAIPVSIKVSDMIYDTYSMSIEQTVDAAEQFSEGSSEDEEQASAWSKLFNISDKVKSLLNRAAELINDYVESLAVMIVTSCVIPLLVLLFFLWIIKLLTGAELAGSCRHRKQTRLKEGEPV